MKKIIVLVLCTLSLQAQQAGLRAGVSVSNITNTAFSAYTGYYAAFTGTLKSKGMYGFQPEVGFMRVGAKGQAEGYRGETAREIRADYAFLYLMNKFSFHPSFGLTVGPGIEQEVSNSPFLRKQSSVSLNLGMEFSLPGGLGVEARVRRGVRDIYSGEQERSPSSVLFPLGNNAFLSYQVGLFYKFSK